MKHCLVCIFFANIICLSAGNVFVKVCDPNDVSASDPNNLSEGKVAYHICDPNTCDPNEFSTELMVGQTISFVVTSDSNDLWSGGFFLRGDNRGLGTLTARDKDSDPNSRDWIGSHLAWAGSDAFVSEWKDSVVWGFDLYNDVSQRTGGDWFVIDYTATEAGNATVEFRDYSYSWEVPDPNVHLLFTQIPTRDFNNDGIVNLIDFQAFAKDWETTYQDPNDYPKTDIVKDGSVDLLDLIAFSEYWFWGIPVPEPEPLPDPNIFYSVVDANGLDEITITVGDSVVLYIDQNSLEQDYVVSFDLEVTISDPNLGWIDNRSSGTAMILSTPVTVSFISPGIVQDEGIQFFATSLQGIQDGTIAAFVYTATDVGNVTLDMLDILSEHIVGLTPILIHQVAPPINTAQALEEMRASGELNVALTDREWEDLLSSVEDSQTNDPNAVSQ